MTRSEINLSLDIQDSDSQVVLEMKRLNNGQLLIITLTDNGSPYPIGDGCKAFFAANKPDGTHVYNECTIAGSSIYYVVTAQTTAAAGLVNCEIRLIGENDDELITSPRFSIYVVPTVYQNGGIPEASKDEFDALSKLLTDSKDQYALIKSAYENGDFVGEKGDKGDKGDTGISPTLSVEDIDNGKRITVNDASGAKTFDILNGENTTIYTLNYYDHEPTENQKVTEVNTLITLMNDTENYLVYVNYSDGKHPASVHQYGGNIFLYFTTANEAKWYEISYFPASNHLQYGYLGWGISGNADAVTYTEQALTDEQKAQARENIGAISLTEVEQGFNMALEMFQPMLLPEVTTADNDKFLQVVNGKATWVTIELAEDGGF